MTALSTENLSANAAEHSPWQGQGPRLHVLLVGGPPDSSEALAAVLRSEGHAVEVDAVGRPDLGVRNLAACDVLVIDLAAGGVRELSELRTLPATRKKPLVVTLGGAAEGDDRTGPAEAGGHLHLGRPFDPALLVGLLRRFQSVLN